MVIYKDDNRKIEIISSDEVYETGSNFYTEKQFDKARYFELVSDFFENFFDDTPNLYGYEQSTYYKIREMIKANKYPELSTFINENTVTVAIDAHRGQKTKTFFDKKYTDQAFDLISLYHRLQKERALLVKAQKALKNRAFIAPNKTAPKLEMVNTSIKLVEQAIDSIANYPDYPYVNRVARLIHDQVMFKFNTKTFLGQNEIRNFNLSEIPTLDQETKVYFKHLYEHLNSFSAFKPQNEHTR